MAAAGSRTTSARVAERIDAHFAPLVFWCLAPCSSWIAIADVEAAPRNRPLDVRQVPQGRLSSVAADDLVAVAHQSEEHPFWLHLDCHDYERRPGDARHASPALTTAGLPGSLRSSSVLSRRGPFETSRVGPIRTERDIFKRLVDLRREGSAAAASRRDGTQVAGLVSGARVSRVSQSA